MPSGSMHLEAMPSSSCTAILTSQSESKFASLTCTDITPDSASPKPPSGEEYLSGLRLHIITLSLAITMFLVSLDTTIISTAVPQITHDFKSTAEVGWYGSSFLLGSAVTQAPWGKVYAYLPLKLVYLVSLGLFEVGCLICAVSHNSSTLIVGRAIAGVGGSGIGSGIFTMIGVCFAPRKRPILIGIIGLAFLLASFVGPVVGGAFTSHLTWRWCFWINLPVGGWTFLLVLFAFRTPSFAAPPRVPWKEALLQLDPAGVVLLTGTLLCFLLALEWGVSRSWDHPDVIGCLVGFLLLAGLFLANEIYQDDRAMVPRGFFLQKALSISLAFIFLAAGAFFTLLYYIPIYFQAVEGVSAAESGIRTLPLVISAGLMAIVGAILLGVTGYPAPFMVLGGILICVAAGLLYTLDVTAQSRFWIPYQILAGLGIGTCLQVPIIYNQASVATADMPTMTATTLFSKCLGASIFMQVGQAIFLSRVKQQFTSVPGIELSSDQILAAGLLVGEDSGSQALAGVSSAYLHGLRDVYVLVVAVSALATLLALFMGRERMVPVRLQI